MHAADEPGEARPVDAPSVEPETRIDAIWAAAPSDDNASRFLDALLAEGLICPVWTREEEVDAAEHSAEKASEEAAEGFAPMTVERDGVETFCLFDSVERLEASGLEAVEFVAAPGRVFFQLAAEAGAQIAFNPAVAQSDSLFSVETVEMVAALAAAAEEEELVGEQESVEVHSPEPPQGEDGEARRESLLAALSARLAAAIGAGEPLQEAWLVSIRRIKPDGEQRGALTLVLGVGSQTDAESQGLGVLARDLSRLGGHLAGEGGLDVAILASDERAMAAARRVGFGLTESAGQEGAA